jgi:hypothetical protein
MNSISEEQSGAQATATAAKPPKRARVAPQGGHVAPRKGKSARKASPAKKAPKGGKKPATSREGTKTAKVLDLLKRPDGATLKELIRATEWQAHSVRGFLSGTVGKKMGVKLLSTKREDGERSYSVKG